MRDDPFWLKPTKVLLRDGTSVTLRPSEKGDLEATWEMFSTLSHGSLEFLPIQFPRERVEGWFTEIDYDKHLPVLGLVEENGKTRVIASSPLVFSR